MIGRNLLTLIVLFGCVCHLGCGEPGSSHTAFEDSATAEPPKSVPDEPRRSEVYSELSRIYGIRQGEHLYYFRCSKLDEDLYEYRSDGTDPEDVVQELTEWLWHERHDTEEELSVKDKEELIVTLCDENKKKIGDYSVIARFNIPVFYAEEIE